MQVGKRLRQVDTQAVLMSLECIFRKKGNHIEVQCPHRLRLKREERRRAGGGHMLSTVCCFPLFGGHIDGGTGNLTAILVEQANDRLALPLPARCHAGEEEKWYLSPFFKLIPVETVVLQCHPGTSFQYGIDEDCWDGMG